MRPAHHSIGEQLLLAPSRLVTDFPLESGYDLGIVATAAGMDFLFPKFDLDEDEMAALLRALETVKLAYDAYHYRRPMTEEELAADEIGGYVVVRSTAERLQDSQTRRRMIRAAVAAGDATLPVLRHYGLVLTASTYEEEFAPVPASMVPEHPYMALVSVKRLG